MKMWYIYTMEYYSAIKKNKIIWMVKESYMAQNNLELKLPSRSPPTILCKTKNSLTGSKNEH